MKYGDCLERPTLESSRELEQLLVRHRTRPELLPEEFADEVLEVVDAVLALGREAAGLVGA
jgi:hypothetical protein